MKTLQIVLLITGILVAGIAFNTVAQGNEPVPGKELAFTQEKQKDKDKDKMDKEKNKADKMDKEKNKDKNKNKNKNKQKAERA